MATKPNKKFEATELERLKEIRKTFSDISYKLGQIEMQRLSLKDEKLKIVDQLTKTIESEKEIAKELLNKYGKGTIDIDSGEFIPSA